MFQYRVWRMDLQGELGLALAHPLYCVGQRHDVSAGGKSCVSREFVFGGVRGADVGSCAAILWRLTASVLAAAVGTIALAVSHTFWLHAVIAEVYDLYALLLVVELLLVERSS